MKSKIEELARLAGFNAPSGDGYENKDSYTYFSYEQFAELLISEVLKEIYDEVQYETDFNFADRVEANAKSKFGIK